MEVDFLKVTQGTKSVAEYEEQFTALSHFSPTLVADEGSKCRKFLEGLHPIIKRRLTILKLNNYADLVDRAIIVERDIIQSQVTRSNRHNNQPIKHDSNGSEGEHKDSNGGSIQENKPFYNRYDKYHNGTCYLQIGACFGYG